MNNGDKVEYIVNCTNDGILADVIAEEAIELAQYALKLKRKSGRLNPTPLVKEDIISGMIEEYNDLMLAVRVFNFGQYLKRSSGMLLENETYQNGKLDRWYSRLVKARGEFPDEDPDPDTAPDTASQDERVVQND